MAQRKKASTPVAAGKAAAPRSSTNGGTKRGNGGSRRPTAAKPAPRQRKAEAAPAAPSNKTGLARLGKGELEALVLDYLKANPRGDLTPSEVANVLTRSGGAVANALERLVRDGKAKRVSDKPRRYRLASARSAGKAGGNRR